MNALNNHFKLLKYTFKKIIQLAVLLWAVSLQTSCSEDDDSEPLPEPTVHELLMSGRWYIESVVGGELGYCHRISYYDFVSEQTMIAELFNLVDGDCESVDYAAIDYEVLNDEEIRFTLNDEETYVYWQILSISEEELVAQRQSGEIVTYDKTEG